MATPSSWHLYLLSAAIAPTCLLVTAPEDSVEFFLLQGFIWGVVTFFFYHARRVSWISNGLPDGPLAVQPWQDAAPCWCYEAAFWTQILTYVPSLLRMLFFTCRSREAFITSSTLFLSEHTESVWFERMLFAQLFGYMMRDMFMQGFSADPLLAMHHLLVIVLTLALGFYDIPGGRMCATLGCVIELGTAGYCHFIVWRIPSLYRYLMNISNVVWVVGVTCIVYLAKERSKVLWGCCAITVALVVGRTDMMRVEIRKEAKRIKRGDDLAHAHEVRTAQYPSTQCSFSRRRLKRTLAQISSLSPAHAARPLPMASAARPLREAWRRLRPASTRRSATGRCATRRCASSQCPCRRRCWLPPLPTRTPDSRPGGDTPNQPYKSEFGQTRFDTIWCFGSAQQLCTAAQSA
ncbi:unnamed protein product [Prorocentrum cordatum]|uniref:TLC domain-containing protein n=1 Tax=Prorocentrum cordatum TaxID=2364126 RepID=A0ABN9PPX3_9DINO|nr:unnamed protein product [Polarella glacialis]